MDINIVIFILFYFSHLYNYLFIIKEHVFLFFIFTERTFGHRGGGGGSSEPPTPPPPGYGPGMIQC